MRAMRHLMSWLISGALIAGSGGAVMAQQSDKDSDKDPFFSKQGSGTHDRIDDDADLEPPDTEGGPFVFWEFKGLKWTLAAQERLRRTFRNELRTSNPPS
jgi:hypothetical protein